MSCLAAGLTSCNEEDKYFDSKYQSTKIVVDQIYLEDEQLYDQIDRAIRQKGRETYLPLKERLWLRNSLYDSFRRLDILQELLDDKEVTEIMINGAGNDLMAPQV